MESRDKPRTDEPWLSRLARRIAPESKGPRFELFETLARDARWFRARLRGDVGQPFTDFRHEPRAASSDAPAIAATLESDAPATASIITPVGAEARYTNDDRAARPDSSAPPSTTARDAGAKATVHYRVGSRVFVATTGAEQTLLEAGLAAGADLDFSCTVGGCGTCKLRLVEGHVELEEPNCLSQRELDEGYVLACVGRARGAVTVEKP